MAMKTQTLRLFPWIGGLNTTLDPSVIPSNQLTIADNLIFGERGSRKKRSGINFNWDTKQASTFTSAAGSVTEGTDLINITAHGFTNRDPVKYTTTGTVIAPLVSGTVYYVRDATTNSFGLAATPGGVIINLTNDGVGSQTFNPNDNDLIGMAEFWFGTTSKTFGLVTVAEDGTIYSYTSTGVRTALTDAGTAYSGTLKRATFAVLANKLVIATDQNNKLKFWDNGSGSITDVGGTPVNSPYVRVHLGRLWIQDPSNLDRLHYSSTGLISEWNGTGDSGAIDIGIQDGDKEGITGYFSFKGDLFVLKRTKIYRVSGFYPEEFTVELITNGVGCVSFNSITYVDQDDVYWLSERGLHSLSATANFGDFEGKFISKDIQASFNDDFLIANLKYSWGAYLPQLNSLVFAINENSDTTNNDLWLYNIPLDSWYRWPDISCQCMATVQDTDKKRLYIGSATEKVAQTLTTRVSDLSEANSAAAIVLRCKTGVLFVDNDPYKVKGFKRFTLIYKKVGSHTVTAKLKIDNYSEQSLNFELTSSDDLLGSTFILGESSLSGGGVLAPYTFTIDGWGRGIQVTIEQSGPNEVVEIQGFQIEYEFSDQLQEVNE